MTCRNLYKIFHSTIFNSYLKILFFKITKKQTDKENFKVAFQPSISFKKHQLQLALFMIRKIYENLTYRIIFLVSSRKQANKQKIFYFKHRQLF